MSKVVVIDFDETITHSNQYPFTGEPAEGVKEALTEFREMGYAIHILSCRTGHELRKHSIDRLEEVKVMTAFMEDNSIPFDVILNEFKPMANVYIDDRAVGHRGDWKQTVKEFKELEGE